MEFRNFLFLEQLSTWNNILYLERYSLPGTVFFTWNSIFYLEQNSLPGTVFFTWNRFHYFKKYSLTGTLFTTWNSIFNWNRIHYLEQYSLTRTIITTWNSILYLECSIDVTMVGGQHGHSVLSGKLASTHQLIILKTKCLLHS